MLPLPTIRNSYDELAHEALRDRATYKEFLADLLAAGCTHREERRKQRLVRDPNFPRPKRLEDFDFAANPNIYPGSRQHPGRSGLGARRAAALPHR